MSKFHTLFPQVIYQDSLEDHSKFKEQFASKLIKKYEENPTRKRWDKESNSWAIDLSEFVCPELLESINGKLIKWFNHMDYGPIDYNIEAWWTVHKWHMHQHRHMHNGHSRGFIFLCGIYYLQLNEKDNCVVFENVNNKNHPAQLAYFGLPIAHKYYMESTYGSLQFKEGDIVLFNPDQPHYVPAAKEEHDDYRIALVFNVSAPFRLLSIEE